MDGSSSSVVSSAPTPPNTVYVSVPQHGTILQAGSKAVQSVIHQNQASVIQSTALQTVHVGKSGNIIFLKGSPNSVIQSPAGHHSLHGLQVVETESEDSDPGRKQQRQILVRRPSYRKILNDLGGELAVERVDSGSSGGGSTSDSCSESTLPTTTTLTIGGQEFTTASLLKVIPAGSLQLASSCTDTLQTIAMSSAGATSAGTLVHYNPGSDAQFIVPVGGGDLSSLKFSSGGLAQSVVLAASAPSTTPNSLHSGDNMGEEANRKREVRLLKNREAARECRAKKKEYIKCLENRVAVLENQNKALIEELKTLKALYCQNS